LSIAIRSYIDDQIERMLTSLDRTINKFINLLVGQKANERKRRQEQPS